MSARPRGTSVRRGLLWLVALAACQTAPAGGAPGEVPPGAPPTFRSGTADLAYAIDLPPGTGPFPGVVLVHGSGTVRRGDLLFMSRLLVARGLAVLRYDKRGVGDSGGAYSQVGVRNSPEMIPLLASDAAAAVDLLMARPEIDRARVGLVGGSQAGWIIPVAAGVSSHVSWGVILSGPTVSVGREIAYSDLVDVDHLSLEAAEEALVSYTGPEGFDPRPVLDRTFVPLLWLYGLVDDSIPTRACLAVHAELGPTHPFDVLSYANLGHGLGPAVWDDVYRWLDSHGIADGSGGVESARR